jgi:hypothetical protein
MIPLAACIYYYLKLSLQHFKTMFNVFTSGLFCSTTFHCERQEGWFKGDDTKHSRWTQVALAYMDKIYIKSWTCEKWLKEKDDIWTKSWWKALQQMAASFDWSLPLTVPFPKCLLKVILKGKFEMTVGNVLVPIIMIIILNQS